MPAASIAILRGAFIVVGAVPGDWNTSWKTATFKFYSVFMDFSFLIYSLLKLLYCLTYTESSQVFMSYYGDDFFEFIMALSLTLERAAYRWKSQKIVELLAKLGKFQANGEHVQEISNSYRKVTKRITMFSVFLSLILFLVTVGKFIFKITLSVDHTNGTVRKYFLVNIWVPRALLESPWYEIVFVCNFLLTVAMMVMANISLVAVPWLAIQISCRFEIVAKKFQRCLSKLDDGTEVTHDYLVQRNIKATVRLHQIALEIANEMNACFHIIVLIKLVFMSMPTVIVSLVMSQAQFLSGQYLRHALFFTILLCQLFFFCFYGEQLIENSLKVQRAVYNNRWYTMSLTNKRLLLTVATRAGRPAKLEVWPHFIPVSLESFLSVCQFIYSVYSVLVIATTGKA